MTLHDVLTRSYWGAMSEGSGMVSGPAGLRPVAGAGNMGGSGSSTRAFEIMCRLGLRGEGNGSSDVAAVRVEAPGGAL